ncbi:MAG: methyltransferase, partial [Dehalococcoidia bacterium]|nr:methyltransferase [Dehalococcoidia bacterium]
SVSMSPGDSVERGVYDRSDTTITLAGVDYRLVAAHGLPESDSPSHATRLLIDALRDLDDLTAHRALVFNPGQGHVPIALSRLVRPSALHLIDRDLLALRCARRNLLLNGCSNEGVSISHQVGLAGDADQPFDLIAGVLREDEGPAGIALAAQQASHRLAPGGLMLLAGGSTAASRLTKRLRDERLLRVEERKRHKGAALLVLRH